MSSAVPDTIPLRLNLKKDKKLEVEWKDGTRSVYPIAQLRAACPCAGCRGEREQRAKEPVQTVQSRLRVLSGDHSRPLAVTGAELVGSYAIRLDWSDGHGSGIYSFAYLRELAGK